MTLRKIYLSSISLTETNERIIEIAIKHGYSSQEAFSRAFKEIFGVSPNAFRLRPNPLQSYVKLTMNETRGYYMDISKKLRIEDLQKRVDGYFDHEVLNILNGQQMYEEFSSQQLMGKSDYAPFNKAMCVHDTVKTIFSDSFKKVRAAGHQVSLAKYEAITVASLQNNLFSKKYQCIVLWFGEDMFCQMNLLTVLAYLEQISFVRNLLHLFPHYGLGDSQYLELIKATQKNKE